MIKTALKKPSLKNRVKVSKTIKRMTNHPGIMLQKTSSQVELKLDCM